jgi:cell division protein FtsB|tara:strand:- start:5132 stop:7033 length:1902 start_codon:yes stop_codon:yes gene_type:complete
MWKDARADWDVEARDAVDFFLGNHYSQEESDALRAVGQADFVIDRVYAAIEKLKSLLTSRSPKYSAVGREDSDSRMANVWRTLLEYVWDISDGDTQFKQAVHDYATAGMGYLYTYIDPEADYGRGEVKITYLDPFRVYVDPASRNRYADDASGIILSTILTEDQIINMYPQVEAILEDLDTYYDEEDYPSSGKRNSSASFTPDTVYESEYNRVSKYRILERFTKIKVPFYRIFNKQDGSESILDVEKYEEFVQNEQAQLLMTAGLIEIVEVKQTRIKVTATAGEVLLYEQILNTDIYPVVPIPNIWTGTPYPKSDISKVKDSQRLLNKLFSLTLSHAQASAGLKLLVPEGSVDDLGQLEQDWAKPNAVIPYNPEFGAPHFPAPQSLSNEFYNLISRIEHYIDLSMGIPELMQGFREGAPETVRGTAMLAEMGETRGKSKLRDIEGSLTRLGRGVYNLSKGHYTYAKTFRIIQPNNDITEYTVNMYDDKSQELNAIQNDITIGHYDVRIISGSTLPSNRVAEYNMYLEAFKMNLVDDVEVLKKTEIFDKEGVLQRKGQMAQLQSMNQQLQEQVKKLSGDLQTSEREAISSRKRTETEKFKSKLNEIQNDTKFKTKVQVDNLRRIVDTEDEVVRN